MISPETAEAEGLEAAEGWLELAEKGDAPGSHAEASATFREAVTAEQWASSLERVQDLLGRPVRRKLRSAEYSEELPGVPDGHYVVLIYDTTFELKRHGTETVTLEREESGEWRVSGYFVR